MRTRLSRYVKGAPNARRSRFWICRCRRLRRREPSGSRRIGIGGEDSLDRRGIPRRRIDDAGLPAARLDRFIHQAAPLRLPGQAGQAIHLDGLYQNRYACLRGPTFRLLTIGFFLVFMTALVKIHRKGQMTLPTKLRSLAGISEGDLVEAELERGRRERYIEKEAELEQILVYDKLESFEISDDAGEPLKL